MPQERQVRRGCRRIIMQVPHLHPYEMKPLARNKAAGAITSQGNSRWLHPVQGKNAAGGSLREKKCSCTAVLQKDRV